MEQIKTIYDFVTEHQRVPCVDSGEMPWRYKGWLLWYVQCIQEMNSIYPDRWGYLSQILLDKRIPGPIVPVKFSIHGNSDVMRNLKKVEDIVYRSSGGWSGFCNLLHWLSYGLGLENQLPEIPDKAQEEMYRLFDISLWLMHPGDHLGHFICETRGTGWNPNAFFPTPHEVIECMTQVQFADQTRDGQASNLLLKVMDPCVGTGRMLMHAGNYSLRLYGMDIDPQMVQITKINGAVYVPWMLMGVQAVDALSDSALSGSALSDSSDQEKALNSIKSELDNILSPLGELDQFLEGVQEKPQDRPQDKPTEERKENPLTVKIENRPLGVAKKAEQLKLF